MHRIAGRLGAVAFHRQPGFLPDIERREVFAADQPFGSGSAAVVGIALGVPVFAHFFRQARVNHRVFQMLDQQRIAAHFAVVVHAEVGVFGGKTGPVAALPQQPQPVVAQPVFLVAARIAPHEVLHFLRAGLFQPGLEFPVSRPRLQRVAPGLRQQLRQPALVAAPEGFVHLYDEAVASGIGTGRLGKRGGLCEGGRAQRSGKCRAEKKFV